MLSADLTGISLALGVNGWISARHSREHFDEAMAVSLGNIAG